MYRSTRTLLALTFAVTLAGEARAQNLFGGTGRLPYRDITRSPELRDLQLDYDYIAGGVPSWSSLPAPGIAGAPTVEVRRNFVYVEDSDGILHIPYRTGEDIFESFNFALEQTYAVVPDEFVFVYLFTSFETGVGAFFYQPEANDTRGINEQQFDMNGSSPREGFVFMNYYRSFDGITGGGASFDQAYARSVFNQEAGHRWASFIQVGAGTNGTGADVVLGRDDGHWSYFMQSSGSPMEGNDWSDMGGGNFRTFTSFDNWHFSQLDLYLMGLIPPEDVDPFFVITNPVIPAGTRDLFGQPLNRSSPPQIVDPITISGTRVDISIDTVILRSGNREPPAGQAPTSFRVVFILLAGRNNTLNEVQRSNFEDQVDDFADGFRLGTDGLATLDYTLMTAPKSPIGGPCEEHRDCDGNGLACLLVPPVPAGSGMCTRGCNLATECPESWCCQPASSGALVCLPSELCQAIPEPDASVPEPDAGGDPQTPDGGTTGGEDAGGNNGGGGGTDGLCECDLTTECDMVARNNMCDCDPECRDGCTNVTTTPATPASLAGLAVLLAAAFVLRRRK